MFMPCSKQNSRLGRFRLTPSIKELDNSNWIMLTKAKANKNDIYKRRHEGLYKTFINKRTPLSGYAQFIGGRPLVPDF